MSGTYSVVVGNKGRIVVPAEVRDRVGLVEGTPLILFETAEGLVLMTRSQLRERVRDELRGVDLVSELMAERRHTAQQEDVV